MAAERAEEEEVVDILKGVWRLLSRGGGEGFDFIG